MRKLFLAGRSEAGKTTLIQALKGEEIKYDKTQYVDTWDVIIDTPGEYAESKNISSRALTTYSYESDLVGQVVGADEPFSIVPQGLPSALNRPFIGIITNSFRFAVLGFKKNFFTILFCGIISFLCFWYFPYSLLFIVPIGFSTINLSLNEVYRLSTEEETPVTFGDRLGTAFKRGLKQGVENIEDFVIYIARNWLTLIVWAVIIVLVVVFIRRRRANRKEVRASFPKFLKKDETAAPEDTEEK